MFSIRRIILLGKKIKNRPIFFNCLNWYYLLIDLLRNAMYIWIRKTQFRKKISESGKSK